MMSSVSDLSVDARTERSSRAGERSTRGGRSGGLRGDADFGALFVLFDRVANERTKGVVALHVAEHALDVLVDRWIDQKRTQRALASPQVGHDLLQVVGDGTEVGGDPTRSVVAAVQDGVGEPVALANAT